MRGGDLLKSHKPWIEGRLEALAGVSAIAVGGFSVMDNHLHVLLRIHEDVARGWSAEEVARRWAELYPRREPLPPSEQWLREKAADVAWVEMTRTRLCDLGWFMESLKEPLERKANRDEGVRGHIFEARYRSIPVVVEEALLPVAT